MSPSDNLILIAEDDAVLRLIIVKQLGHIGFIGHTAENGAEAVVMATQIPYSMIFMDIHMPKMDGLAATKKIREMEAAAISSGHVPIVALTATADREVCLAAGMDDFLSKPITIGQLQDTITKWLDRPAQPLQRSCSA